MKIKTIILVSSIVVFNTLLISGCSGMMDFTKSPARALSKDEIAKSPIKIDNRSIGALRVDERVKNYSNVDKKGFKVSDITVADALRLLNNEIGLAYTLNSKDIKLPNSDFRIKTIDNLAYYVEASTDYKMVYKKAYNKNKLHKVKLVRKNKKVGNTYTLKGNTSFFEALSQMSKSENLNIVFDGNITDKNINIIMQTQDSDEYLNNICQSANYWCTYDNKTINVNRFKTFVIDAPVEGVISFNIGSNSSGTSSNATSSSSGTSSGDSLGQQSTSYSIGNASFLDTVDYLQESFGIPLHPSNKGFYTMEATPTQYKKLHAYFQEEINRKEVIYMEVQLLRVDLSDEFKFGLNWNAISDKLDKSVFQVGADLSNFDKTENKGTLSIEHSDGKVSALVNVLQSYGNIHRVDSWHNQMNTGSPLPFSNYERIRYFTTGSVASDTSTETTVEINEDEIGFRGVLSTYKGRNGYSIEGFVDISAVTGWVEAQIGEDAGQVVKAPLITGKNFRISTKLSTLGRTVIAGGFRVRGIENHDVGIPWLQTIPTMGWLFNQKHDISKNSEFIILITLEKSKEGKTRRVNPMTSTEKTKML